MHRRVGDRPDRRKARTASDQDEPIGHPGSKKRGAERAAQPDAVPFQDLPIQRRGDSTVGDATNVQSDPSIICPIERHGRLQERAGNLRN